MLISTQWRWLSGDLKFMPMGCIRLYPSGDARWWRNTLDPRLTNSQADDIYENSPRTYLFGLVDGEHVIDGDGIAAFINHCCNPNCEADEIKGRVIIRAIRNIQAGEELAYDYNLYDGDPEDRCAVLVRSEEMPGKHVLSERAGQAKEDQTRVIASSFRFRQFAGRAWVPMH